ncbi:lipocalin-like domain-containing protein [Priestia endophytica]|uniref:lipocalin-like domain-containing protein n=1 Tax=Priestia endophytica TaxID=135735 RepID=UPI000F529901|nr:lipocalin-like domain-containing protein [Priestia endophytica]RPK03081.1 hypothetical protein FH5_02157 [Priestia endophytica]
MSKELNLSKKIIGTYRLISYEARDQEGNVTYPMGKDCTGFIMYLPEGHMSVHMMAQGRPKYASGELHNGTKEEMASAAHGYLAYAGPYEVDEEKQMLIHHMSVSLNPTWLGESQKRPILIEGNRVTITGQPIIDNGVQKFTTLVWERVEK